MLLIILLYSIVYHRIHDCIRYVLVFFPSCINEFKYFMFLSMTQICVCVCDCALIQVLKRTEPIIDRLKLEDVVVTTVRLWASEN